MRNLSLTQLSARETLTRGLYRLLLALGVLRPVFAVQRVPVRRSVR